MVQPAKLEKVAEDRFQLSGDVTLYTASTLAAVNPFKSADKVTIDLATVGKTDSGTLVLLVNWQRKGIQQKADIMFVNLPDNLLALMDLYDLDSVLQVQ